MNGTRSEDADLTTVNALPANRVNPKVRRLYRKLGTPAGSYGSAADFAGDTHTVIAEPHRPHRQRGTCTFTTSPKQRPSIDP